MSLHVRTRRVGDWMADNADAIDITRQSAMPGWLFLAPSADIIKLATEAKKRADAAPHKANVILGSMWTDCAAAYVAEMRAVRGFRSALRVTPYSPSSTRSKRPAQKSFSARGPTTRSPLS